MLFRELQWDKVLESHQAATRLGMQHLGSERNDEEKPSMQRKHLQGGRNSLLRHKRGCHVPRKEKKHNIARAWKRQVMDNEEEKGRSLVRWTLWEGGRSSGFVLSMTGSQQRFVAIGIP